MTKLGSVKVGGNSPIRIMGILNTSPESFFKKSIKTTKRHITHTVKKMEEEGADFIDVGGMSTAPYLSTLVSEKVETARILEAVKIIQNVSNLPISVDTCRSNVALAALENGVDIINDISGLKYDPQMINVVCKHHPSIILCAYSSKMTHGNQIITTRKLLQDSIRLAKKAKISSTKIVLDPAIGFFRNSGRNSFFTKIESDWINRDLLVIRNIKSLKQNYPVMVSVSNKSFIGKLLNKSDPSDRLSGSLAAETVCVLNGADIIRTHNVSQTRDATKIASLLSRSHKGL